MWEDAITAGSGSMRTGTRSILIGGGFLLAVVGKVAGAVVTVMGGMSGLSSAPLSFNGTIPGFFQPYTRLTSIDYAVSGAAEVTANASNTTGFNEIVNINGGLTINIQDPGGSGTLTSLFLFPHESSVLTPFSSLALSGIDSQMVSGSIATNLGQYNHSGPLPFKITSAMGSGSVSGASSHSSPQLQGLASLTFNYNVIPIGLTQADPILPASIVFNVLHFSAVPSGRWFDPPTTSAFRYDITSPGDSFTDILAFPTGFTTDVGVLVNGTEVGRFGSGDSVHLPAGTRSFTVFDLNPAVSQGSGTAFPLKLGFNRDGIDFSMTPVQVPEPVGVLVVLLCGAIKLKRTPDRDPQVSKVGAI